MKDTASIALLQVVAWHHTYLAYVADSSQSDQPFSLLYAMSTVNQRTE